MARNSIVLVLTALIVNIAAMAQPLKISGPLDFTQQAFDVQSYDVMVSLLNAPGLDMTGRCDIAMLWNSPPPSNKFYFHLRDLSVDSCFYNGVPVTAVQSGVPADADYHYEITPPPQLSASSTTVTVYYHGKMTAEPLKNGMQWGGVQSMDNILFAMGVGFYNNYVSCTQHWMPCYDHPSDKATFHARFLVPLGQSVASNGILEYWPLDGTRELFEYTHKYPCSTYLYTFAVSNFRRMMIDEKTIPMEVWSLPADSDAVRFCFKLLPRAVAAFEKRFGKYPFEKVGYVNTPIGSMEHETMISYDVSYLRAMYQARDTVNSVAYHELAHQWFGDMVTCRDFRSAWLNESFATYCETIWAEELGGFKNYINNQGQKLSVYLGNVVGTDGATLPLYDFPRESASNYPGTIYYKGAVVLGMLRYILGDSLFFGGVNHYLTKHKYSTATTQMLLDDLQEFTGKDLKPFFDDWVYGKGYPQLNVNYQFVPLATPGYYTVNITVDQAQPAGWTKYKTLPIEFGFSQGGSNFIYRTITLSKDSETFRLDSIPIAGKGNLKMAVNINSGPSLRSMLQIKNITSVGEESGASEMAVFPNPANESVRLGFRVKSGSANISVYNLSGRELINDSIFTNDEFHELTLDLREFASGIYYIIVESDDLYYCRELNVVK